MKFPAPIFITCAKGIVPYLEQELTTLGYPIDRRQGLGIFTRGTLEDAIRLNLQLRTGLRVLLQLHTFSARTADDVYKELKRLEWETVVPAGGYLCVTSAVDNPTITDFRFANLRVKDAIVDRIQDKLGRRPNSGPDRSKSVVFLYWKDDDAAIFLDTSGEPLTKRGYRKLPGTAPMQESLAAALILATQWQPHQPFVDLMCGSGTLGIEAAMIALNKAPGLLRRNFGFMHFKFYEVDLYQSVRQELRRVVGKELAAPILCNDRDGQAARAARQNAKTAGVEHLLTFQQQDFRDVELPEPPGCVILNPPYGMRLEEEKRLQPLYQSIGDYFKQAAAGYWGYIFTGNLQLAKKVGLKTHRRLEFFNGAIETRLLEYELYSGSRKPERGPE